MANKLTTSLLDFFWVPPETKTITAPQLQTQAAAINPVQKDYFFPTAAGPSAAFVQSYNNSGMEVSAWTALNHSSVNQCVRIISETIAKLKIKVINKATRKEVKHSILTLLRNPNAIMNYMEFMTYISSTLELNGNSIVYIQRNDAGEATGLIPLNPSSATWNWSGSTGLPYYTGWHPLIGTKSLVPARDILHFKNSINSTRYGYEGESTIGAATNSIGISLAQDKTVGQYYSKSTISTGVVEVDDELSPEAYSALQGSFKSRYTGNNSANETMILQKGIKFTPIQMNARDAQLLESRQFQITEIARWFGVPLSMLAYPDAKEKSDYESDMLFFLENTMIFKLKRIATQLEDKLFFNEEKEAFEIQFDYSDFTKTATLPRYQAYQIASLNGFLTVNEIREREGLAAYSDCPEADQPRFPANTVSGADIEPQKPATMPQVSPQGGHNGDSPVV